MKKQFPSDELVEAVFKIIKSNSIAEQEIFDNFIYSYIGYSTKVKSYNKETFFETNEKDIKNFLKSNTIDNKIFNLNLYKITNEINDEFFFNSKISLKEKQNLINVFSIRNNFKFLKSIKNDEFKLLSSLIPIEDLYLLYIKFEGDHKKIKILEENNPEIIRLIKQSLIDCPENAQKYFCSLLFKKFNYISAYFSSFDNKFNTYLLSEDYKKIQLGEFCDEYNIDCNERTIYLNYENLKNGTPKEKDAYYDISNIIYKSNAFSKYYKFIPIQSELTKKLEKIYNPENIIETMKKLVNDKMVDSKNIENLENFIKGFTTINRKHTGGTYFDPYYTYFIAISKEDCLSKISTRYSDIFNYIQSLIDKYHYQVFDNTYIVEPESEEDLDKIWKIYLPKSKSDLEELIIYIKKDFSNEEIIDILDKEIRRNLLMDKNKTLHISPEYNEGMLSEINFFAINAKTPLFKAITVAEEIKREEKFKIEKENINIETER